MRSLRSALVLALSIVVLGASLASAARIGVRAHGGMSRLGYGQFNDFADGINALIAADPTLAGEMDNIHWVPEAGVEATVPIAPALTIGAGAGFLRGCSSYELAAGGSTLSFEHCVTAYPITATLYVSIPAPFTFARPYAYAGGGAYYAKTTFEQRLGGGGGVVGYDADLTAWGWGLHGGAGLSFPVAPTVRLEVGVQGRYAVVSGFEGTATQVPTGEKADVILGFYEGEAGYMVFGPVRPEEASSVEEGEVDLSGFGLVLGATVTF